jgi:two-component system response regulator HupR/HoxA
LLESELFGHVKGSFTGAIGNKTGLFEEANGGVIFLDEIGDISLSLQVKLLRAVQEGEIKPVGTTESRKVKVRVIAATHRNLELQMKQGRTVWRHCREAWCSFSP